MVVTGLNFVTELLIGFLNDLLADLISHVGFLITEFYEEAVKINQTKEVASATVFSMSLGAALSILMVAKQLIGTYGIGNEGDADQDPMEIIFRLCMALGMMGANAWMFDELLKFSTALGNDVTYMLGGKINAQERLATLLGDCDGSLFIIFLYGGIISGTLIFGISAFIRGAEITLNKILLPIFALDLIHANCEKWKMFIFQYVISFFSFIIQMFCYQMFAIQLVNLDMSDFKDYLVVIGWLILSIRTPKWLEKYIYATGTGQAISKGAGSIGQVIMYCGMRM